jgi:hypothetical protein
MNKNKHTRTRNRVDADVRFELAIMNAPGSALVTESAENCQRFCAAFRLSARSSLRRARPAVAAGGLRRGEWSWPIKFYPCGGIGRGGGVGRTLGVACGLGVGVGLGVSVGVAVGVDVGVGGGVVVGAEVGVKVAVAVAVAVAVGVAVGVAAGLAVAVGVGVGVPDGTLKAYTLLSAPK